MSIERVFYVAKGNDPYDHFMYVCGPNESGLYASCHVYPIDDGRFLQAGIMRMVPECVFAGKIEVDRHETGRVMAAVDRKHPTH